MPAYLVELPNGPATQLIGGADKLVVFAADAADARAAASGHADGDSNAIWDTLATVTEVVAGTELADSGSGWEAFVRLSGAATMPGGDLLAQAKGTDHLHVGAVALNDGGVATYVIDDILTAVGGTFTRAATFRVITVSTGVITAVELVDPGHYSVAPSLVGNAVSGGGGTGALLDLTMADPNSYEAILGELVGLCNSHPDIANSDVDLSEGAAGARLFTVSSIADGLGDGSLVFEFRQNGTTFAPLVGAITHEGVAGAVITAAIPASPIAPPRVVPVKS
ncbi:MAG: hypothetical protein ACXABY_04805 [Candidatus Thorarchaeota archaeon]|jgi:hypothetical protein